MQWLKKLPGSVRSPSGLEWTLWRKLPLIFLVGTALPLLALLVVHLLQDDGSTQQLHRLQIIDYMVVGVVVFHWSAVATLAVGCLLVMVMKGPGYVADGFEVSHSDRPRAEVEPEAQAQVQDRPESPRDP